MRKQIKLFHSDNSRVQGSMRGKYAKCKECMVPVGSKNKKCKHYCSASIFSSPESLDFSTKEKMWIVCEGLNSW